MNLDEKIYTQDLEIYSLEVNESNSITIKYFVNVHTPSGVYEKECKTKLHLKC